MKEERGKERDLIAETAFQYNCRTPDKFTLADYYDLPNEKRVELIDGVFYNMSSPSASHQSAVGNIWMSLKAHVQKKRGSCKVFLSPLDVQLDCDEWTMVQPDLFIVCEKKKIGAKSICGAPDFVAEVLSLSSVKMDTVIKLEKYRKAGVREYWIVDLIREKVLVYDFENKNGPVIYGMESKVPVRIFGGECEVDFRAIAEEIKGLQEGI